MERVKTLFLSPLQPQNAGYPGFVSLQVPTSEAAVSADTHAFARLPPRGLRGLGGFCALAGRAPSLGGPGPKPPGDLAHRTLGPGSRHSHRHSHRFTSCKLTSAAQTHGSGLKTLGCYHNPQALQSHERRGSRLRSSISIPRFWDLANKPLSPASRQPSRTVPAA